MADAADFDRQMAAQNARGEEILWHEVPNENILVEGLGFLQRKGDGTASPNLFPVCCRPSGRR